MTDLDLDAVMGRAMIAEANPGEDWTDVHESQSDVQDLIDEVRRLTALVNAKQSWIDGAKVDLDGYDEARAERDAYLAALGAIASMPSASVAVRDVARHALLNGGAS